MNNGGSPDSNSKYAWREIARGGLPKRSASERVADFLEIYGLFDEATARAQASRCIQCPNPTCVAGCPLCNPIPEWMQLTAEGRFLEAAAVLGSVTNLAEICARLCPGDRLCEQSCLLDSVSEPVSIQALEQFLAEYAFAHKQVEAGTAPPNGRKVAVVGSGPGGLACADELAKLGYGVTVFDAALVPGGLLVNGLPAFKLDQSILQRRLELLRKRGVVFRLGVDLWERPSTTRAETSPETDKADKTAEITLGQLRAEFDAVFLGFDARQARPLDVPGAALPGVVQALPFLLQQTVPVASNLPPLDVRGQRVLVLGGGDTAMDCLRAALRYGAREAVGVYRRDRADMPCSRPEYENAVEEGARVVFCAAPVAVLANPQGRVRGVRLIRTELGVTNADAPRRFALQPGTEFELETDWVITALGFEPLPCPQTADFTGLTRNDWGGLVVDSRQMTTLPGVFAGGDIVHGPSLLLHAVRDARQAAAHIHSYLKGNRGGASLGSGVH